MRFAALLLVCLSLAAPAWAQSGVPAASAAAASAGLPADAARLLETERFKHLATELRCLVCQNQTLADSSAPLAQDLRNEVVRMMAKGQDDETIKRFLVDRYGEFVLYRPALSGRNALLWGGPFVLLAAGAVGWWRLGRRRRQASTADSAETALRRVDDLLGR